jgi:phenylalanyl-tRNA synthetase beta chain
MLYSHAWLAALVPHGRPAAEVQELMGRHVATVDEVRRLREDLAPIVVARVVEAGRHPNSDHLWVTKVDDGSGTLLDVVCGAPTVGVNTLYPFARTGTTLPGGLTIEKRKIRGQASNGMLCSARELALGEDQAGIMALAIDVAPGTPLLSAMPVGDVQFDVDVLPNRPDLLSHLGMARELAALTRASLVPLTELAAREAGRGVPPVAAARTGTIEVTNGGVTVRVEDDEGCPRYMAVVVRGVRVGPSPDWLVQRLGAVGVRSISNVVDVTNYALHGLGQPMHAFDLARVTGATIVVRRGRPGESLLTLDGVSRKLDPDMTVIADAERAVAIAGVMGGRETEVTDATRDVLLEVATFEPRRVRQTRRRLGFSTDASYRFERGVDPEGTTSALAVAAQLLAAVAGGQIEMPLDVGRGRVARSPVTVRAGRLSRLLGDNVTGEGIAQLLTGIGFRCTPVDADTLTVTPPSWRHDVRRDADVVEEVARLRGYDVLSDALMAFRPGVVPDDPRFVLTRRLRDLLVARGFHELRPLPFVRGDDLTHERVRNPLAEDEPHLRLSMLETLARRAEYNLARMQGDLRLFEIGSVFEPSAAGLPLPRETMRLGLVVMGARRPRHFTEPTPPPFDEWDAKALGEELVRIAHASGPVTVDAAAGEGETLWTIRSDGVPVGQVTRLRLDAPVWAAPAFGVEIDLSTLANADVAPPGLHADAPSAEPGPTIAAYRPVPSTPAAEFALALIVPDAHTSADVARVLRSSAGDLLEHLELFDEYRGEGIPKGTRSLAWRLTFRDPNRTLRDKEVEGRRSKILESLERDLGVRLRSN